jgi:hypothetical protein
MKWLKYMILERDTKLQVMIIFLFYWFLEWFF